MIRKLNETDRVKTMEYLSEEPAINLFIIGDIEGFGFDEDFQDIWADFNEFGEIDAVFLRYYENFIPYSKNESYDWSEFKTIIVEKEEKSEGHVMMSGKASIIDKFDDILPNHRRRSTYFCELRNDKNLVQDIEEDIKQAGVEDSRRIYDLINEITEFNSSLNIEERIKNKLETKTGRVYYYEDNGLMTSVAQTSAENSMSAMVVGVATLKEYRQKGLMSKCLSKLCRDVLDEGKTLCLFYDNPKAGRVYHKLGFETLDKWVMVNFKEE